MNYRTRQTKGQLRSDLNSLAGGQTSCSCCCSCCAIGKYQTEFHGYFASDSQVFPARLQWGLDCGLKWEIMGVCCQGGRHKCVCCGVLLFTFWLYGQRIIIKSSKKCELIHPLAKYLISFDFILPLAVPCVLFIFFLF